MSPLIVDWTGGFLTYKGTAYEIAAGGTDKKYIYWDPNYTTLFRTTDNLQDVFDCDGWLMCINDEGTPKKLMGIPGLHAGIIQAGTITAAGAQIADAAVTTAKINDLAVETLKIADHAVTGSGWAYTQGEIDFGASEVTIQSIEFTTTGENLAITFVSPIKKLTGDFNNYLYSLRLYRDTTKVYESNLYFHEAYVPSAFIAEDSPSAGTYTYEVRVIRVHTVTGRLKDRALRINEYKK